MSDSQQIDHPVYSRRDRAGVAKRLDLIFTELEDLRVAVQCILADRQRNDPQQDAPR